MKLEGSFLYWLGLDLAPLSEQELAGSRTLPASFTALALVSSAMTRALETASYVACATGSREWSLCYTNGRFYQTGRGNFEKAQKCFFRKIMVPLAPMKSLFQYETAER